MAKKIEGYQCEICHSVYAEIEKASLCEKKHGKDFEYELEFEPGRVGPTAVKCTFTKANGEKHSRNYY